VGLGYGGVLKFKFLVGRAPLAHAHTHASGSCYPLQSFCSALQINSAKRISASIPHASRVSLNMDVHEPEVRSYNMSQIKGKNTKPEMLVRKFLFSKGFRYRVHVKTLPGKPDIVLPKYKTVIFIHGCFWHGHDNCKYFVIPKTRTEWWLSKINSNKRNDAKSIALLRKEQWKIIILWECELKPNMSHLTLEALIKKMLG
jgi:DNA mismatch endonuclease, patch repair protein